MAKSLRPVEPNVLSIIEALGLGTPAKVTFVKTGKLMFTVDEINEGIRVIYSDAFLERIIPSTRLLAADRAE